MTDVLRIEEGTSCRDCIRRHVGEALIALGGAGTYRTCGGCGFLRVVYEFTYWFPYPEARPWHPSMGRAEPTESTLCEECGEEGGNHAADCSTWPGLDDGTGRDDELTEFDIGWDWQPPERLEDR